MGSRNAVSSAIAAGSNASSMLLIFRTISMISMRSRWSHKMMKLPARFASLLEQGPTGAIIARELQAAILNRYLQVFCTLAVAGGIGAALLADTADAAPMLILQIALYFVSLFALLIGTISARA